jgi:L-ascorbate metabolism protein UlaG (beta-lactamase superfamily)
MRPLPFAATLKSEKVVPMHYGTFGPLKGTPEQLKKAWPVSPPTIIVMQPGEVRTF